MENHLYGIKTKDPDRIATESHSCHDKQLEIQDQTAQTPVDDTPEQTALRTTDRLTDLQKKAIEIAQQYKNLSLQDKIRVIAQSFGGTCGEITTSPCTGKWRGTSDMSIKFDNGVSLFIGNHSTPKTKTVRMRNEFVNAALVQYNPEIISATKKAALSALMQREAIDNELAAQKGLKPYTLLNVEFIDGTDDEINGHIGWYYVTLAVDGKIRSHIETWLYYAIAAGKVSSCPSNKHFFTAGTLKETDIDYVFDNVGFSSTSRQYSLHISDAVRKRAEKTLAEREAAQAAIVEPQQRENPLKGAKQTTEQNENMINGQINNEAPEASTPESDTPAVRYYPINETAARHAHDMNSMRDYKPGSATAEYRQAVDEAAAIAKRQKEQVDPMYHEKIDSLLDNYARKLAENMSRRFSIESRVPSILISGGGNFPTAKKRKQNAALDRNMQEWRDIQGLIDKIRSTGMGGISADDPQAVQKLEKKLAGLERVQETMKAVNAYYRKHKTLEGCPHLTPEQIKQAKAQMSNGWRVEDKPYPTWALSNNNAEIRRVKARIASLTKLSDTLFVSYEFEGGKVEANKQLNRLQIFFDDKPSADIRAELKANGFHWSPKEGAWQRQLNDNAIHAAGRLKSIRPTTGDGSTEIREKAAEAVNTEKT